MTQFEMDPRFAQATTFIADWPVCRVLLAEDARYPWLQLLTRCGFVTELLDIPREQRLLLMEEIALACEAVKKIQPDCKLNIGTLGIIVPQMHIHVLGRTPGDPAWPGPVWGHQSEAMAYDEKTREFRVAIVRSLSPKG